MKFTLDEIPKNGRWIYVSNNRGGLTITKYPLKNKRPFTINAMRKWHKNYHESKYFSSWDYVPKRIMELLSLTNE